MRNREILKRFSIGCLTTLTTVATLTNPVHALTFEEKVEMQIEQWDNIKK